MDRVEDRVKLLTRLSNLTQKWAKCSGAYDKKDRSEQKQASYSMYCETPLSANSAAALQLYLREFTALITIRKYDESTYHFKDPDLIEIILSPDMEGDHTAAHTLLRAFVCRNNRLGYVRGICELCAALCAFSADDEVAFWLLCTVVENLRPDDFYERPPLESLGLAVEADVLQQLAHEQWDEDKVGLDGVKLGRPIQWAALHSDGLTLAIESAAKPLIQLLFLDAVPFETMLGIWDRYFSCTSVREAADCILQYSLALLQCRDAKIAKMMRKADHLKDSMLAAIQDIELAELEEAYAQLATRWDRESVTQMRQETKKQLALGWTKGSNKPLLAKSTKFTKDEIDKLAAWFEHQNLEDSGEGVGISRRNFKDVLQQALPGLPHELHEPLFRVADEDGSDDIDFKELLGVLSTLSKGTFEEKVKLWFDTYDQDRSGFLDLNEVEQLATDLLRANVSMTSRELDQSTGARSEMLKEALEAAKAQVGEAEELEGGDVLARLGEDVAEAKSPLRALRSPRESSAVGEQRRNTQCSAYALTLLQQMDTDKNNMISIKEFTDYCREDPTMQRCFGLAQQEELTPNGTNNTAPASIDLSFTDSFTNMPAPQRATPAKNETKKRPSGTGVVRGQQSSSEEECCTACSIQ